MSVREGREWKKLSVTELGNYLWKAADILRGSIDSSDYKNYIFGLVFIKRISDMFEEQYKKNVAEFGEKRAERQSLYEIFVAPRARWSELRKKADDRGGHLNKAFKQLEDDNPQLKDIFNGIDFAQSDRIPDETIERLMQHFDGVRLRNSDLVEADLLGRAYEYLIKQFADDAGKKGGEFYTPTEVVELLVSLLKPTAGISIYDPTVGSGGMLVKSAKYVKDHKQNPKDLSLVGQEKNLGTWSICKMNMIFHDLSDANIQKGDTIRDPKNKEAGRLQQFDIVIANPPFSLKGWGDISIEENGKSRIKSIAEPGMDSYDRFVYGKPPKSYGDLGFVQHMVASCKPDGRVGVVVPHGVLFRGGGEAKIRRSMLFGKPKDGLDGDLIEAVIGLPPNLFFGTTIPAAILIINKKKPEIRKNEVLFIYASEEFGNGTNQNVLRKEDILKMVSTYNEYQTNHSFKEEERYSRIVDLKEICDNESTLNITRYIDIAEEEEEIDLSKTIKEWEEAIKVNENAINEVKEILSDLGVKDS